MLMKTKSNELLEMITNSMFNELNQLTDNDNDLQDNN